MAAQKPFPTKVWYSAGWSHELGAHAPLKRKIADKDLVLFRDAGGHLAAIDALCPHRGADLGLGKICNGHVQCPFHGWEFDRQGACVKVPSQHADQKIPKLATVRAYEVVEQQRMLWVWVDEEKSAGRTPPFYDFLEPDYGRGMRRAMDIAVLANAPFVSVVENAIDNTHPPFIHPGTLAGEPAYVANQTIAFDDDMRGYRGQLDPDDPVHTIVEGTDGLLGLNRRILGVTKLDRKKCYFRFDLGGVVYFYDQFESGHEQIGFVAVTPADETHSWFFGEHVRSFGKNRLLDAVIRKWMRKLNGEDVWHVEKLMSSRQAHGLDNPVSVVADTPSLAFRKIFFNALSIENADMQRSANGETGCRPRANGRVGTALDDSFALLATG